MPSVLTACCAGLLIAASAAGRVPLAVAVFLVQLVLVVGWFRSAALIRGWQAAGGGVAVAAAAVADVALLLSRDHADVRSLAGVLAGLVGAAFVVQLSRRDGRARLTAALVATVATGALAVAGAVMLGVRGGRGGADVVVVALVAVAAGVLPVQAKVPMWASLPAGIAIGTGLGALIAQHISLVGAGAGGAIAAVAAALALAARAGSTSFATAQGTSVLPVASTLPIVVVAPGVLVIARIMVG